MKFKIMLMASLLAVALFALGCSGDQSTNPGATSGPSLAKSTGSTGGATVSARVGLKSHVHVEAQSGGCTNNPGPYITLTGEVSLGGLDGLLIFRNNTQGTHEHQEDVLASLVIVPAGESIQFHKQPPLGGVGGNPWIYLQLLDGQNKAITGEVLLGRCVQGLMTSDLDIILGGVAKATVASGDCENSGGPTITIDGALTLGGLNAKLIFRNNAIGTHEREEPTTVSLVIIPKDSGITFPKPPPLGGAGGNPLIYFAFTDPEGNELSSEFFLGRCVQLGK
jgi:hypothetical protein